MNILTRLLTGALSRKSNPPIPDALWKVTIESLPFLAKLNAGEQARLCELSRQFLAKKQFSAAGGLVLDDAICISIAAQACLPILNLGLSAYNGWFEIIVYPDEFVVPCVEVDECGVVHEYHDSVVGEVWEGGPLLLSCDDVQKAGSGFNVVIHECAHRLDRLNGDIDGIPGLHSGISLNEWQKILGEAYHDFCNRVAANTVDDTGLDPYGSEDPAEFFAVMSEAFFETPVLLNAVYPAFYRLLSQYYKQDTLGA